VATRLLLHLFRSPVHFSGFSHDKIVEAELLSGLPFINMEIVDQAAFVQFTKTYVSPSLPTRSEKRPVRLYRAGADRRNA